MEVIISSTISAAVTLIVCLISNHSQNEKTRALMEYKLEELTKRVDKHNNTIERTYNLEQRMAVSDVDYQNKCQKYELNEEYV